MISCVFWLQGYAVIRFLSGLLLGRAATWQAWARKMKRVMIFFFVCTSLTYQILDLHLHSLFDAEHQHQSEMDFYRSHYPWHSYFTFQTSQFFGDFSFLQSITDHDESIWMDWFIWLLSIVESGTHFVCHLKLNLTAPATSLRLWWSLDKSLRERGRPVRRPWWSNQRCHNLYVRNETKCTHTTVLYAYILGSSQAEDARKMLCSPKLQPSAVRLTEFWQWVAVRRPPAQPQPRFPRPVNHIGQNLYICHAAVWLSLTKEKVFCF